MKRAYKIEQGTLVPVIFDPKKPFIYISNALFLELYRSTSEKMKEAQRVFESECGTDDFQLISLTGNSLQDQQTAGYNPQELHINVPVETVYKVTDAED